MVTLWCEGDNGWIYQHRGRFHMRCNPLHVSRAINMREARLLAEDEVTWLNQ